MVCCYVLDGGEGRLPLHAYVWKQLRMDHSPVHKRVGKKKRGWKSDSWEERGWNRKKRSEHVEKNCENLVLPALFFLYLAKKCSTYFKT